VGGILADQIFMFSDLWKFQQLKKPFGGIGSPVELLQPDPLQQ